MIVRIDAERYFVAPETGLKFRATREIPEALERDTHRQILSIIHIIRTMKT